MENRLPPKLAAIQYAASEYLNLITNTVIQSHHGNAYILPGIGRITSQYPTR